jgi:hypothetical protein
VIARLSAWWASGPSTKTVTILLLVAAAVLALRWTVLAPMFSHEMGFIPFDLQPRMNRGMLVIQVGAARGHPLGALYGAFVTADLPISLVLAFVTVVFWRWLHLRAPNRVYAFLTGGGIMLLPLAVAGIEMSEHRAFFSLLHQRGTETYADAIAFAVAVHNVKAAVAGLCNAVTLSFILVTAVMQMLNRKPVKGGVPTDPA